VKRTAALAALLLAAAAAGFFGYRAWHPADAAPDLVFQGLDGQPHRLADWRGKLVLLNFWATWCAPCLKEIPLLAEAHRRHAGAGLQLVGVAVDDAAAVQAFLLRQPVSYPVMIGGPELFQVMDSLGDRLGALPFSVLVGRDGAILERISGDLDRAELDELLADRLP